MGRFGAYPCNRVPCRSTVGVSKAHSPHQHLVIVIDIGVDVEIITIVEKWHYSLFSLLRGGFSVSIVTLFAPSLGENSVGLYMDNTRYYQCRHWHDKLQPVEENHWLLIACIHTISGSYQLINRFGIAWVIMN